MRALSATLFAAYLFILLWVVLFKFAYDPVAVLRESHTRGVNWVPFTQAYYSEMIANFVAFVPFGVMLGVNFKRARFGNMAAAIFAFSLAVEIAQYALALGITDVTDVITNTLGGCTGLAAYAAARSVARGKYLDEAVFAAGTLILLTLLYLRVFVFVVRY